MQQRPFDALGGSSDHANVIEDTDRSACVTWRRRRVGNYSDDGSQFAKELAIK